MSLESTPKSRPPEPSTEGAARRLPVAVLGATGTVGQRMLTLLERHPWFEVVAVAASERSAGRRYADVTRWIQAVPMPESIAQTTVQACTPPLEGASERPLIFSALGSSSAREVEAAFAESGHTVISNASAHRMDPGVPLLVPEVNPEHLDLARISGRPGTLLTNPNCSTIGLVLALKPLIDAFGVDRVHVVSMQAVSGAGLPGVSSYEVVDNVIPLIAGEEEKLETEPQKIFGRLSADGRSIVPAELTVSAQCNRVPVVDGHTLCVSVGLGRRAEPGELVEAWRRFAAEPQTLALPSAPNPVIHYLGDEVAPQPRLHRDLGAGMAISIGRLRPCPLLDYRFVTLSHNTIRGAAGGTLLVAELARLRGLLDAAAADGGAKGEAGA